MKKILIVGAGLTGAVVACELAGIGLFKIDIIDYRDHIAGNCHTERCPETGIIQHLYGPHIFHTNNKDIWDYVNRFASFYPFVNRVMATTDRGIFSMPINLLTINQFFGKQMSPIEAEKFISMQRIRFDHEPANFEEQALATIGEALYENFFRLYTIKQWGSKPEKLSAEIFKRIPIRFTYDDNYFHDIYQGIPREGYTEMIRRMLDHKNISLSLNFAFEPRLLKQYDHVVYSGAIDEFFQYRYGRLGYRTVYFSKHVADGTALGTGVMNYCNRSRYTRKHEHKYFSPWESHKRTVYFTEFSKETGEGDIPFYPKRLKKDLEIFRKYVNLAKPLSPKVSFAGRLGAYRYISMHEVIESGLELSRSISRTI